VERIDWAALEEPVRRAVEERTGQVRDTRAAAEGKQSHLALLLDTNGGRVFLKGIRDGDHGIVRQRREAMINPVVAPVAPRLLWRAQTAGWDLLGFEAIPQARHPDYCPGSPDLPRVVQVMNQLSQIPCPDLPVKHTPQRWAGYLDDPAMAHLLDGNRLLHSDFSSDNILITPDREWIIDWAWPTRGGPGGSTRHAGCSG
jgi:RIO1 family